jgi:hypothetical protein
MWLIFATKSKSISQYCSTFNHLAIGVLINFFYRTNKWYRFDDEVVEEIDLHLEPSIEDQKKDKKEDKKVAPKSPKKQTGKPAANKKEKDDNSQSGEEKSKSKSKSNTNRGKNDKTVLDITEENDTNEFKEG